MFFIKDSYATVWKVAPKEKYVSASISTSEKDKEDKYIYSNWFAIFVGKSKDRAKDLKEKQKIKILSAKLTSESYEKNGEKKTITKVTIFDFELLEKKPNSSPTKNIPEDSDELPF